MTSVVRTELLNRHYRGQQALEDVSIELRENAITGLLGRNGAGKTTLMKIMTGQEFPTSGTVTVFGENPLENEPVLRRTIFVRESQVYPDFKVCHAIKAASWFYPNWDAGLADQLVSDFDLPLRRPIKKLSRGMHSAVGIVIGLAARAEFTLFDEPYLGLDAVARQIFYDRLLADYAEHPRTVLLSTHLIDEVANLLEQVIVIDHGRITLDAPADDLRGNAMTVSGPRSAVEEFVAGRQIWHRQSIGSRLSATVAGPVANGQRTRARDLGLDLEPVSLQQLVVHSTGLVGERVADLGTDGHRKGLSA